VLSAQPQANQPLLLKLCQVQHEHLAVLLPLLPQVHHAAHQVVQLQLLLLRHQRLVQCRTLQALAQQRSEHQQLQQLTQQPRFLHK
jgi:hypothetical protein